MAQPTPPRLPDRVRARLVGVGFILLAALLDTDAAIVGADLLQDVGDRPLAVLDDGDVGVSGLLSDERVVQQHRRRTVRVGLVDRDRRGPARVANVARAS